MAISSSDISRVTEAFEKRLDAKLLLGAHLLVGEIKSGAPVITGNLKDHTGEKKVSPLYYRIFNNADYVGCVEFGTAPHTIKPANKKALFWKGAKHPVKSVEHPGTRPNPFFRTGFRNALPKLRAIMEIK